MQNKPRSASDSSPKTVLFLGGLIESKGFLICCDLFPMSLSKQPRSDLFLWATSHFPRLSAQEWANKHSLDAYVKFLGPRSGDSKIRIFRKVTFSRSHPVSARGATGCDDRSDGGRPSGVDDASRHHP